MFRNKIGRIYTWLVAEEDFRNGATACTASAHFRTHTLTSRTTEIRKGWGRRKRGSGNASLKTCTGCQATRARSAQSTWNVRGKSWRSLSWNPNSRERNNDPLYTVTCKEWNDMLSVIGHSPSRRLQPAWIQQLIWCQPAVLRNTWRVQPTCHLSGHSTGLPRTWST